MLSIGPAAGSNTWRCRLSQNLFNFFDDKIKNEAGNINIRIVANITNVAHHQICPKPKLQDIFNQFNVFLLNRLVETWREATLVPNI